MNVTSGTTNYWAYTWNAAGRLLNVTKNGVQQGRYAYDGQARQTESLEAGSSTTFYAYYGSETLYKQFYGSYSIDFIYAQGLRIARVDSSSGHHSSFSTIQYFHSDALGSIRMVTSSSASASFANGYQPYGLDNGAPVGSSAEFLRPLPPHSAYPPSISNLDSSIKKPGFFLECISLVLTLRRPWRACTQARILSDEDPCLLFCQTSGQTAQYEIPMFGG